VFEKGINPRKLEIGFEEGEDMYGSDSGDELPVLK